MRRFNSDPRLQPFPEKPEAQSFRFFYDRALPSGRARRIVRGLMPTLRRFALGLCLPLSLPAAMQAASEPAAHPADSAEPQAEVIPARGVPAYADASADSAADGEEREDTAPVAPPAPVRPARLYRFGLTLVTPLSGVVEQRVPVSMKDGASGRMGAWSYGGDVSVRRITEDFVAYGNFDYRRTDFAFDGVSGGAPWADTDRYRFNLHAEGAMTEGWWWYANGGVSAAAEEGASLSDAFTGRLTLGAKRLFSDEFSLYMGLSAVTRMDDSPIVIPMLGLDWRSGRWSLRTVNGVVVSFDTFGDKSLVWDISALYDSTQFRLRDEPGTGRSRSVEFQEVPVAFGVTKSIGRFSFVRAYVACIAWSDYRFRTEGEGAGDFQTSPGALFGLNAGIRF